MICRILPLAWRAFVAAAVILPVSAPSAHALGERFSYAPGNVLTVSGGLWTPAGTKSGPATPAQVTAGQTTPDYLLMGGRQSPNLAPNTVLGSPRQPSDLRP